MPLKVRLLELIESEKIVDAGAVSQRVEKTHHVWVEEFKPRRFKVNLAKATAAELNIITQNIGGVVLAEMGEMIQQGGFAMYFKPGNDIDVLIPPPQTAVVSPVILNPTATAELHPQVVTAEPAEKLELPASTIPSIVESKGGATNRPPQPTR
jgi:hypothetical protein